jgi:hypothetical protein
LRHPISESTSGWYLWSGEYSDADDFFKPICVKHLIGKHEWVIKYLGLNQGWRFLIAPDYEDVWEDTSLLRV